MVEILDTTLREGEQTPGVAFASHVKLEIASKLNEIGIDYIEAGHPAVSDEINDAVRFIAGMGLPPKIAAHSRSTISDVDIALNTGIDMIGIFYCVSEERLNNVFNKNISQAIEQIVKVVRYVKEKNPAIIVRYTPEDTVRSKFSNVVEASTAAIEAGADIISVADTTGYMIQNGERSMYKYVSDLKNDFGKRNLTCKIAVHCHNDRGLALANALDGMRAGADIIDASVLGLGERAGIVDLAQLLSVLTVDYGVEKWNLTKLDELYKYVSKFSNEPIPKNQPITGENAFRHCAGVHSQAALINPVHYQSLNPEIFGRKPEYSLDHMSGKSALNYSLEKIGMTDLSEELKTKILLKVKQIGHQGRIIDLEELKHIINYHQLEIKKRNIE